MASSSTLFTLLFLTLFAFFSPVAAVPRVYGGGRQLVGNQTQASNTTTPVLGNPNADQSKACRMQAANARLISDAAAFDTWLTSLCPNSNDTTVPINDFKNAIAVALNASKATDGKGDPAAAQAVLVSAAKVLSSVTFSNSTNITSMNMDAVGTLYMNACTLKQAIPLAIAALDPSQNTDPKCPASAPSANMTLPAAPPAMANNPCSAVLAASPQNIFLATQIRNAYAVVNTFSANNTSSAGVASTNAQLQTFYPSVAGNLTTFVNYAEFLVDLQGFAPFCTAGAGTTLPSATPKAPGQTPASTATMSAKTTTAAGQRTSSSSSSSTSSRVAAATTPTSSPSTPAVAAPTGATAQTSPCTETQTVTLPNTAPATTGAVGVATTASVVGDASVTPAPAVGGVSTASDGRRFMTVVITTVVPLPPCGQ